MATDVRVQEEDPSAPATLGDVLYAGPAKHVASEAEWVALVRRVAAADPRALCAQYGRTRRIVFTHAMRITGEREAAEEVTADVFHDVWRRAAAYDPANGTVIGWIMNQARSRAIDRVRFEHRKKRLVPDGETAAEDASHDHPDATYERNERARAVHEALGRLTVAERQAIEGAFFGELTHAEVAARLHEPLGTVKTRIRSALTKLRGVLTEIAP
jgi:RNA polymerase sigma-70 factor (ECF subfamily)